LIKIKKTEIKALIISAMILGFVFSFREWGTDKFDLTSGILNWIESLILVLIVLIIHELAHKIVAKTKDASTEYKIWSIKKFFFGKKWKFPQKFFGLKINALSLGIIAPIFISLFSNGKVIFATTETTKISYNSIERTGRKFTHLTEFESAIIALAGPLASMFIALLTSLSLPGATKFITINYLIALYAMVPLNSLDGAKIFFGSKILYLFSLVFLFLCFIAIKKNYAIWLLLILAAIIFLILMRYKKTA
jgi:hypothetical protein